MWREIETDISKTSVIAVPADYTCREQQARLANIRAGTTSKTFLADLGGGGTTNRRSANSLASFFSDRAALEQADVGALR